MMMIIASNAFSVSLFNNKSFYLGPHLSPKLFPLRIVWHHVIKSLPDDEDATPPRRERLLTWTKQEGLRRTSLEISEVLSSRSCQFQLLFHQLMLQFLKLDLY